MKCTFLSAATPSFQKNRDALCKSAARVGFDVVLAQSPNELIGSQFYNDNREVLDQTRGAGYWLWKPYLILQQLEKMAEGEFLVYSDAGRSNYYELRKFPSHLISVAASNGQGFLVGPQISHHGPISRWTKRDALILMGMDRPDIIRRPIIQATWSVWSPSRQAINFLESWLSWCSDARCLTDLPNSCGLENYPDFYDHRHDQSILSILSYKLNAPFLDFSKTGIYKVLGLRAKSQISNLFFKRIDDAENLLARGNFMFPIIKSLYRLKQGGRPDLPGTLIGRE